MRVLIVDDEALARLRLRTLIDSLPEAGVEAIDDAENTTDALGRLQAAQAAGQPVDLLLLDIRMPGSSANMGLRLAAQLRAMPQPPAVVFVSAHADHALAAFELDAVDYLTKPVRRERLLAALQRVQQRLAGGGPSRWGATGAAPLVDAPVLVVSDRGRMLRLPLPEVLYLKAGQKTVTLRTATHSHVLDEPLSELEQRLAALGGPPFIRVHRNALVARHAIRALELREASRHEAAGDPTDGWAVRVAPLDEWLAVSRRQVAAVRAALEEPGA
jgi:two-component system response regulator AlgR